MCHNKRFREISDEKCHKHIRIVQSVVAFVNFGLRPFHFRKLRTVIYCIGKCFNFKDIRIITSHKMLHDRIFSEW